MKITTCKLFAAVVALAAAQTASAWTISQNFDSSADGASCGWDAGGGSTVSSATVFSGTKACKLTVKAGDTAYGTWGGVIAHPTKLVRGDQLWFRVRTYMPAGFNYNSTGEGNHLKFLRIHTRSASVENFGYDDVYINPKGGSPPLKFIYEGEQVWSPIGDLTTLLTNVISGTTSKSIMLGTWETYEFYVRFDTVPVSKGGMARVRFWKSGVLMADITDRITLASTDGYSDRSHLFTYWNGGSPATQQMFVDDLVLTSDTPAGRDANGNPYVGASGTTAALPKPPTQLVVQ